MANLRRVFFEVGLEKGPNTASGDKVARCKFDRLVKVAKAADLVDLSWDLLAFERDGKLDLWATRVVGGAGWRPLGLSVPPKLYGAVHALREDWRFRLWAIILDD